MSYFDLTFIPDIDQILYNVEPNTNYWYICKKSIEKNCNFEREKIIWNTEYSDNLLTIVVLKPRLGLFRKSVKSRCEVIEKET